MSDKERNRELQNKIKIFKSNDNKTEIKVKFERETVWLDMIISVGYRVNSKKATQFRQWATQRLKDFLVKGYAINEKRLEQKQQEVIHLKTGIQILSRTIEAWIETVFYCARTFFLPVFR